jgi:hypothetical protein
MDSPNAPTTPSASRFEEALANYLFARDRLNNPAEDATCEEEELASAAYFQTQEKLLRTPAETVADFRVKFDELFTDPCSTPRNDEVLLLFADLRRLTNGEPSRLFKPKKWLEWFGRKGGMYCVRGAEVFLLTPEGADLDDVMFELEASGGREAVNALIRERCGTEEVCDG